MEVGNPAATAQDTTDDSPDDDPHLPGMMEVHVSSAGEADLALDRAVAVITEAAKHHRTGVLVTRIGAGHYIVRAHPAVPYGLVREKYDGAEAWGRS
jgi:hypothetical protein